MLMVVTVWGRGHHPPVGCFRVALYTNGQNGCMRSARPRCETVAPCLLCTHIVVVIPDFHTMREEAKQGEGNGEDKENNKTSGKVISV